MATLYVQQKAGAGKWLALILSILITEGIAFTASMFTRPEISGWYATLTKPSFNPPNWLFAPVWTTLYLLIAIAAWLVWKNRHLHQAFGTVVFVYVIQLALNFSWSFVFFGMHQILGGLIVIALLWLSIIVNMFYFSKFSKPAAWLLLPYLLWVSFASVLNFYIYLLNGQ
ncbi:TspO/MBR family protein [uncultured Mucilaginibacter sp.]|uniref:TspO/MBR family protein n=1 Tax=uncultured Mucilaginibacter sp. TaxID=797541 RepID=UPI0025D93D74|nr:TspO/MBR family protein [uncultured Mucilaginibacter sp.]